MSKTVLLVDYEPRSIDRIRTALSGLGVTIVLATDGPAAEREFDRTLPDLTLVQDVIPKKAGADVCKALKQTPFGARRPVVLLARAHSGNRNRVVNSGADDWISEPYEDRTLLAKVRQLLLMR